MQKGIPFGGNWPLLLSHKALQKTFSTGWYDFEIAHQQDNYQKTARIIPKFTQSAAERNKKSNNQIHRLQLEEHLQVTSYELPPINPVRPLIHVTQVMRLLSIVES